MKHINVVLPAISTNQDLRVQFQELSDLILIAYDARANLPEPGLNPVSGTPNQKAIDAAIQYIQGEDNTLSNIQPTWCWEGLEIGGRFQLMGFAATKTPIDGLRSPYNVLALRGTATNSETFVDLDGWSTQADVYLPTHVSSGRVSWGSVNSKLADYYQRAGDIYNALGTSCQSAVAAVQTATQDKLKWSFTAHSLGAVFVTLAAADCYQLRLLSAVDVGIITFGGLVIGQQDFASKFEGIFPNQTLRIVNICDFVPAIQGLEPPTKIPGYVQIGVPVTFAWQKGELWANHNLQKTYAVMMTAQYFGLLNYNQVLYPISV